MNRLSLVLLLIAIALISHASYQTPEFFSSSPAEIIVENDGWTLKNDNVERRLQYSSSGLRTLWIKKKPEMLTYSDDICSEGKFKLDNTYYDMNSGWILTSSEIIDDSYNKSLLLHFTHENSLYRVNIRYDVPHGSRWWIAKTVSFDFDEPHLVEDVTLDTTMMRRDLLWNWYIQYPDMIIGCGGITSGKAMGVFAFCESPTTSIRDWNTTTGWLKSVWDGSLTTTHCEIKAVTGYITGGKKSAAFGAQVAFSEIWATGNPWKVPIVYNTWYNQGWKIKEADVYHDIPIVADFGCEIFVIDEGWEMNLTGIGVSGDWAYKTTTFPNGLIPIAEAIRASGMEYGFWFSPGEVDNSLIRSMYPEWAVLTSSGAMQNYNCVASPWGDWINNRILTIINETQAKFLKIDWSLWDDNCFNASHNHTQGKAIASQNIAWKQMVANWRNASPEIVIDRTNISSNRMDINDETWFGDWFLTQRDGSPDEYDPVLWKRNFDWNRYNARYGMFIQPGYTMTGTAPAHLYKINNINLLEYGMVSIAASMNLEVSGILEGITPEEVELTKKWVKFNKEMRPWLAYTQPIVSCYNPFNTSLRGNEPVDAYWHLRPALNGRYGFLAAFNPKETEQVFTVTLDPKEYFIPMDVSNIKYVGLNPAVQTTAVSVDDKITFTLTMPPVSWQVVDITQQAKLSGRFVSNNSHQNIIGNKLYNLTIYPHSSNAAKISFEGITSSEGAFELLIDRFGVSDICVKLDNTFSVKISSVDLRGNITNLGLLSITSGDYLNDDVFNDFDLNEINSNFGNFVTPCSKADFNCDGVYDDFDLNNVNSNFGSTGECFGMM